MNDAIPICRSIFNNWVYADPEHLKVWITMLGRARYSIEEKTVAYRDVIVKLKYGEFIFGYKQWSKDTGVSIQRLRTLISRLKEDRMIQETQATSHFTVYFIVNYPKFNTQRSQETKGFSDNTNSQPTVSQQSANSQPTTNKEGIKKVKKEKKDIYGSFENVFLTTAEYEKLKDDFPTEIDKAIEWFSQYIEEKGYKSKSHYLAIRRWVIDAVGKKQPKQQSIKDFI